MNIIIKVISTCLLIGIVSCKENNEFTLSGKLYNKKEKNIYVIYDDPIAKADTIKVTDGNFEYKFKPDTITIFRLVNDSGIAIPIFANKNWEVNFKGSFASPQIIGTGPNKDLQDFRDIVKTTTSSIDRQKKAKDFIMQHRQSYACAYIINDFMIQTANPNMEEIKAMISQLDGHVKDCRIIDIIQKNISDTKNTKSEYINYFSSKDRKGKYISWSTKNETYTLINFWASWDENSKAVRDSLYNKIKLVPKENLRVVNISLDFNKKEWEESCKKENEQWIETCDFKGWNNQIIEQMGISYIPYSILITNNRKIIQKQIFGDKLIDKVKSLTEQNKNK